MNYFPYKGSVVIMIIPFINNGNDRDTVSYLPPELLKKAINIGLLDEDWLYKSRKKGVPLDKTGKVFVTKIVFTKRGHTKKWGGWVNISDIDSPKYKNANVEIGSENLPDTSPHKSDKPSMTTQQLDTLLSEKKSSKPKPTLKPKGKDVHVANTAQSELTRKIEEKKDVHGAVQAISKNEEKIDVGSRNILDIKNGYKLTARSIHLEPVKPGQLIPDWMYEAGALYTVPQDASNVLLSPDKNADMWAMFTDKVGRIQRIYNPEYRKRKDAIKYNYVRKLKYQENDVLDAIMNMNPDELLLDENNGFDENSKEYETCLAMQHALLLVYHTGIRIGSNSNDNNDRSMGALDLTLDNVTYTRYSLKQFKDDKDAVGAIELPVLRFVGKKDVSHVHPVYNLQAQEVLRSAIERAQERVDTYNEQLEQYNEDLKTFNKTKSGTPPTPPEKPDKRLFPVDYLVLMRLLRYTDMTPKDLRTMFCTSLVHNILSKVSDNPDFQENPDLRTNTFNTLGHPIMVGKKNEISDITDINGNPITEGSEVKKGKRTIKVNMLVKQLTKADKTEEVIPGLYDIMVRVPSDKNLDSKKDMTLPLTEAVQMLSKYEKNSKWSSEIVERQKLKAFDSIIASIATKVAERIGDTPKEALESYIDHQIFRTWQPELFDKWNALRNARTEELRQKRRQEYNEYINNPSSELSIKFTFTHKHANSSDSTIEDTLEDEETYNDKQVKNYNPTSHLVQRSSSNVPEGLSEFDKNLLSSCTNIRVSPDNSKRLLAQGTRPDGKVQYFYNSEYKKSARKQATRTIKAVSDSFDKLRSVVSELYKNTSTQKSIEIANAMQLLLDTGIHWGSKSNHGITNLTSDDILVKGKSVFVLIKNKKGRVSQIAVKNKKLKQFILDKKQSGGKIFDLTDSQLRSSIRPLGVTLTDIRGAVATQLAKKELQNYAPTNNTADYAGIISAVCSKIGNMMGISKNMVKRTYIHQSVFKNFNPQAFQQLINNQNGE